MRRWTPCLLLLAACNEPFSNEDLLFLKALPEQGELELAVPAATSTQGQGLRPSQGQRRLAQYSEAAQAVGGTINGIVDFVLVIVDTVRALPPTAREDDKRVWGPFPDKGLEYLMTIERVRTATTWKGTSTSTRAVLPEHFRYLLAARRPPGEWLPVFAGAAAPDDSPEAGLGYLYLNLEAVRALNMGGSDRGLFFVVHDSRHEQRTLEVGIDVLVDPERPFREVEAGYRYDEHRDGYRRFLFGVKENVNGTNPAVLEDVYVVAQWLADDQGRADVAVTKGDLGGTTYFATECWDMALEETFFYSNVPGSMPFGTLDGCAPELRDDPFGR